MLKIGLTSNFDHPDPERAFFKGKRLLYMEESMFHWVMRCGALAYLIPTVPQAEVSLANLVENMDGLLLTGGADIAPGGYSEEPLRPEWAGDPIRDAYETELFRSALDQGKPVLGICRGFQLINVAMGGSLYQDLTLQLKTPLVHRNWDLYEHNYHEIEIVKGSWLDGLYPGTAVRKINSIHHQGIKKLSEELQCEARCTEDQVVEAFRSREKERHIYGVQWHPEFQDPQDKSLLSPEPIMNHFLNACREKKKS